MFSNVRNTTGFLVISVCFVRWIYAGPIVDTLNGPIEGTSGHFSGIHVSIFKGIPYAEPPVGSLRFLPPEPKSPWAPTVYDATEFGPSCPQEFDVNKPLPNYDIDEDCLLLNIYVPTNASDTVGQLPVMVWIHGGGFTRGQGMSSDGTVLAALHDVIVVTVNYRIGVLGFLCTEDSYAPGNYGLLDQIFALSWVKENIAYFGGHPEQITIFGNSAGAQSTHILSLSPKSDGLFLRLISQSGAFYYYRNVSNSAANAVLLGVALGCPDVNNHEKLVNCLREVPADDIVVAQRDIEVGLAVDGEVITHPFAEFVANSDFEKYDFLLGSTSYEAAPMLRAVPYDLNSGMPEELFHNQINQLITDQYPYNHELVIDATIHDYTDWYHPFDDFIRRDEYADLYGDLNFIAPVVNAARDHAKSSDSTTGKTYHYHFDHRPSYSVYDSYVDGAAHTDELPFVIGDLLMHRNDESSQFANATAEEIQLSYTMMEYWTNFAKTG
ncbi:neuroligin-2-like [Glandiceps talaboti]